MPRPEALFSTSFDTIGATTFSRAFVVKLMKSTLRIRERARTLFLIWSTISCSADRTKSGRSAMAFTCALKARAASPAAKSR